MSTLSDAEALLAQVKATAAALEAEIAATPPLRPSPEPIASAPTPATTDATPLSSHRAAFLTINARIDAGEDVTQFATQLLRLADLATRP